MSWLSKWAGWDDDPEKLDLVNNLLRTLAAQQVEKYDDEFVAFCEKKGIPGPIAEALFNFIGTAVLTGKVPALDTLE